MDLLKFEQKGKICESVHFDPSSVSMCITILVLDCIVCRLCVRFRVCFLLGDKHEAKFGGVMSA